MEDEIGFKARRRRRKVIPMMKTLLLIGVREKNVTRLLIAYTIVQLFYARRARYRTDILDLLSCSFFRVSQSLCIKQDMAKKRDFQRVRTDGRSQ